MQTKKTKKIIIDATKLETLLRLGCPESVISDYVFHNVFKKQDDDLINMLLESLVDRKEFSNWGGNHNPSGKNQYTLNKNAQLGGQDGGQVDLGQDGGQVVDKDKDIITTTSTTCNNLNINNIIKNVSSKFSSKCVFIDKNFSASKYDELKVYINEMPNDIINDVEKWLIKEKNGQFVDFSFISKQFINFAKRQNKPIFKEI